MSYEANLIAGNVTYGAARQVRLSSGQWLVYRVDRDTGGSPGIVLRSLDSGASWSVLYGAPGGSNFIDFFADHLDRLYVGVEKNAGDNKPTLHRFDENHAVSPQWVPWYEFTTWTDALNPFFAIDTYHRIQSGAGAGYPRFYVGHGRTAASDNLYWGDTGGATNLRVDEVGGSGPGNGNPQFRPLWAVAPGGIAFVAWIEAGTEDSVFVKQRLEGTDTLSPRLKMSGAFAATQIEDIAVNPTTSLPAVLFRVSAKLYYAELNEDGNATIEKVWDGTNDYDHATSVRGRLQFDARGALFVLAHPLVSDSKPRRVIFSQIRPLWMSSGFFQALTESGPGAETIQGATLDDWGQSRQGLKASTMSQGTAFLAWLLGDGEAAADSDLYLFFPDRQPGAGGYEDIVQSVTGELPPRREEVREQLPSIVLTGEGVPATDYPLVPDHAYEDATVRPTNLIRYEIGQVGGRPKFSDGRRVLVIRHNSLTRSEFDTLDTFMKARYDDLALFNFIRPDKEGVPELKVFPIQKTWEWRRIGLDQFSASHRVLESPA